MTEDIIAITNLVNLYGYVIDERELSRTHELFTADAVYDVSDFGAGVHVGIAAIVALWRAASQHPLAHHATNVIVTMDGADRARVVSKGIGVRANGGVGSATYRDEVVRTPAGWRIARRVASMRRPDAIPAES